MPVFLRLELIVSKSLGTLTLDLVARVGGFTEGLSRADREAQKRSRAIKKSMDSAKAAFIGFGIASAGAISAYTVALATSAKETQNFARLSNASNQEFQRIAISAEKFNISQEKTADILKDVNDKIGDFIQTGGGPLKDFFENIAPKIGVTADQFSKLSGPDALGLYVSSLEKVNLSQADMTFYMEAIASDSTALLPLLRNNGEELKRLGDQAERAGSVLSDIQFEQLKKVEDSVRGLKLEFNGMANEVSISALPAVNDLISVLSDPKTIESAKAIGGAVVTTMTAAAGAISGAIEVTKFLAEELAAITNGIANDDIVRLEERAKSLESYLDKSAGFFSTLSTVVEFDSEDELRAELNKTKSQISEYYKELEEKANAGAINVEPPETELAGKSNAVTEFDRKKAEAAKKTADAQAKAAAQIIELYNSEAGALVKQIKLQGKVSEAARVRFDIENGGLSKLDDGQQKTLIGLADQVDAIEKAATIERDYQSLVSDMRTEQETVNDTLRDRLSILDAIKDIPNAERADILGRAANDATSDAPELSGTNFDEARDDLNAWHEEQKAMLGTFRAERADLAKTWNAEDENIELEYQEKLAKIKEKEAENQEKIDAKRRMVMLGATENLFGSMAGLVKASGHEQSKAYKALFLAEKATSIARSVMAIQTGIALAAANPFPYNLGAMASVAAGTLGIVSTIQSTSVSGMAHEGIDSIPATGTWLLEKGERVTTEKTSRKLDRTLDDVKNGSSSKGVTINIVNKFSQAKVTPQKDERGEVIGIMIEEVERGGAFDNAMQNRYGLARQGG